MDIVKEREAFISSPINLNIDTKGNTSILCAAGSIISCTCTANHEARE